MDETLRAKRNGFVLRSFRDVADQDYIAARSCARLKLLDQFLWLSLSALEKYLKAIILFHDGDTRGIGHNLTNAVSAIKKLPKVPLEINDDTQEYLEYLTKYGGDRYFTHPRGSFGDELFKLDDAVWSVRRFCEDLYWFEQTSIEKGQNWHTAYITFLNSPSCKSNAVKFRLKHKGYLEAVLDTNKHPMQREHLVWKNFRFGTRRKNKITYQKTITGATPENYIFPELYDWIKTRVKLPSEVKAHFEKHTKEPEKAKRTS